MSRHLVHLDTTLEVFLLYVFANHLKTQHLWQFLKHVSPTGEVLALNHGLQRATNQMMWSLLRIRILRNSQPQKNHIPNWTEHRFLMRCTFLFFVGYWTLKRLSLKTKVVKICKQKTWHYLFVSDMSDIVSANPPNNRTSEVQVKQVVPCGSVLSSLQWQSGISSSPAFAVNLNKSSWSQPCSRIWHVNIYMQKSHMHCMNNLYPKR